VRAVAEELGVPRYAVLADLVDALAAVHAGERVDPAAVDTTLRRLPDVAGLEAWWWTDALAQATGLDEWGRLAQRRGGELVEHAGGHDTALRAVLARRA
jgi:hypothetical protein